MQEFLKWTLESIRKDGSSFSWMEERRLEWVPIVVPMLKKLLQGYSLIVITDDERGWFGEYIQQTVNKNSLNRPLMPFVSLKALFPNLSNLKTEEDFDLLEDMLSTMFANKYAFFYVGKSNDVKCKISKRKYDSFIWVMDEHIQNGFYLTSEDEFLDVKLIQLFRLLNRSIDAVLFAEVALED